MKFISTSLPISLAVLIATESHASRIHRELAPIVINGFETSADVTDESRIDLDQRAMETQTGLFNTAGFINGRRIYINGGNSNSFAVLSLTSPLTTAITEGTVVTGFNGAGGGVSGVVSENAASGASVLKVQYNVGPTILSCAVGGLTVTNTTGCLRASGSVNVASTSLAYTYDVTAANQNGRSMRSLIRDLNVKARVNENVTGAFYPDFRKFFDYYGVTDYTDKIVFGGFDATVVTLNRRVFDFSAYDFGPSDQIIKKTVHYQLYPMYVLRNLEVALEKCNATMKDESLKSLDEAVAYYAGSLEGSTGPGTGALLLAHARRRCVGFRTCGEGGNLTTGVAKVNLDVFANFAAMKATLNSGNCAAARVNKENIAKIMFVPFIQGALRYGYLQSPPGTGKNPTAEAEGAAFSMAVLPIVHRCNTGAAFTIYNEMKPNSGNTVDFTAVKAAFESVYPCMGIKCADVGGFYVSAESRFAEGAEPCVDSTAPIVAPMRAPTNAPVRAPIMVVAPSTTTTGTPVATTGTPTIAPSNAPILRTGRPSNAPKPGFFRRILNFLRNLLPF